MVSREGLMLNVLLKMSNVPEELFCCVRFWQHTMFMFIWWGWNDCRKERVTSQLTRVLATWWELQKNSKFESYFSVVPGLICHFTYSRRWHRLHVPLIHTKHRGGMIQTLSESPSTSSAVLSQKNKNKIQTRKSWRGGFTPDFTRIS